MHVLCTESNHLTRVRTRVCGCNVYFYLDVHYACACIFVYDRNWRKCQNSKNDKKTGFEREDTASVQASRQIIFIRSRLLERLHLELDLMVCGDGGLGGGSKIEREIVCVCEFVFEIVLTIISRPSLTLSLPVSLFLTLSHFSVGCVC